MRTARQHGEKNESGADLVVSFFRSPVVLARDQRAIFQRALPASPHAGHLSRASPETRDNVARIFVAARLASRHRAPLLFVEGWRGHAIDRDGAGTHHVTGSRMACLLLKMLQRRGLADPAVRVLRRDASRCTQEEVAAVREAASSMRASRVVGVAGRACPSRRRAASYFHLQGVEGGHVLDCWRLLRTWSPMLTADERTFAAALEPSRTERFRGALVEGSSWLLHWASRAETLLRRPADSLEVRLAHRLRRDRP